METWVKRNSELGYSYKNESTGEVIEAYGSNNDGRFYSFNEIINAGLVTIINEEDTIPYKENLLAKKLSDCANHWAAEEVKDIIFNDEVFEVTLRTFIFASGQIQSANFYEAVNGSDSWRYNWTLKDGGYYEFNIQGIYSFGIAVAAQVENAIHNANDHKVAISSIDVGSTTAAEIEDYDYTVDLLAV